MNAKSWNGDLDDDYPCRDWRLQSEAEDRREEDARDRAAEDQGREAEDEERASSPQGDGDPGDCAHTITRIYDVGARALTVACGCGWEKVYQDTATAPHDSGFLLIADYVIDASGHVRNGARAEDEATERRWLEDRYTEQINRERGEQS